MSCCFYVYVLFIILMFDLILVEKGVYDKWELMIIKKYKLKYVCLDLYNV